MSKLAEAQRAYNEAAGRLQEAADAIDNAPDDTTEERATELRTAFTDAKEDAESRMAARDELQEIANARKAHPVIDTAPVGRQDVPADLEWRDSDGNVIAPPTVGRYEGGQAAGLGYRGFNFNKPNTDPFKRIRVGKEPLTYERGGQNSVFKDLLDRRDGDHKAAERILRHIDEMIVEKRALNETAGTGGEFVPPLWMQDEWIKLLRAGRPYANAVQRRPLPPDTNSINFPSVTAGAAVATQADGGAVQSTDPTTSSLSVPVKTIAGQVDLARQLLDRSVPGMDEVLFDDLARAYATKLDVQCLNGSGSGANATGTLQTGSIGSVSYTSGSPTAYGLWSKILSAVSTVATGIYQPPTAIIMYPSRWYWMLAALDSQNRPLVVPSDQAGINNLALMDTVGAENLVGRIAGVPVIIDASIPTNLGAGTNQDIVIVQRLEHTWLFEDEAPRMKLYEEVLSGNLQIRCQIFGYFAFTAGRYPASICTVGGTGLTTPSF